MQLSQKQKTFSNFVAAFLKSSLNFEHCQKKMTLIADVFQNYTPTKIWLDECLKSPVSRDPSESNMVNALRHCSNLNESTFTIFIDHCKEN